MPRFENFYILFLTEWLSAVIMSLCAALVIFFLCENCLTLATESVPCHGRIFMDCHHYCKKNCRSDRVQCIYHCQNGCGCRTAFIVKNNGQCRKLSRCTIEESQEEFPFTMDKLLTTTSTTKSSGASNDGLNLNPNLPELVLEGNNAAATGKRKIFAHFLLKKAAPALADKLIDDVVKPLIRGETSPGVLIANAKNEIGKGIRLVAPIAKNLHRKIFGRG